MKSSEKIKKATPYLFTAPTLISIFVFSFLPIVYTIYIAFTNYSLNHMNDYHFIGWGNFQAILTGPLKDVFLPVFVWTVVFAVVSAGGTYIIGLIFALVLSNENLRERNIYKSFLIIPWAIPGTISLLTWSGLLNEQYGGINVLLHQLHLISGNIPWMTDPLCARIGIIIVNLWLGFPWMMNVSLAALSAIDDTYYEAAEIDGASKWQQFLKITLPSITTSSLPLLISSFAMNFNNFTVPYLIMGGGPPIKTTQYAGYTDLLAGVGYKFTKSFMRYDYASAFSILVFILIGAISFIQMKKTNAFKEVD
jgi:arabinogalactan oligomer/maltooligosaccharide transport system permease protein